MSDCLPKYITSSGKDDWETPLEFFAELDKEFNFTLDPCCTKATAKCQKYYTTVEDGLLQDWSNETVYCNPPYSRGNQSKWIEKCHNEGQKTTVVMLLPARTDTKAFHRFIYGKSETRFVEGRLKFVGAKSSTSYICILEVEAWQTKLV